jgi:hypothetical protein
MATAELAALRAEQAHRDAMETPIQDIARTLEDLLSRRLTAVIVGVKDGKTVARWASGETSDVRGEDTELRLRTAYQIAIMLLTSLDSAQTVKAWFIGLNPQLGDTSPAEAIREGRLRDALAAARAFVAGG